MRLRVSHTLPPDQLRFRVGSITFFEVWFVESGKIPLSDECRNNTTCMLCPCLSVNAKIKCLATRCVCVPKTAHQLELAGCCKDSPTAVSCRHVFKYFTTIAMRSTTKWVAG